MAPDPTDHHDGDPAGENMAAKVRYVLGEPEEEDELVGELDLPPGRVINADDIADGYWPWSEGGNDLDGFGDSP